MRHYRVLCFFLICGLAGCGSASERRMVCILPGYDSVIYYHGSSSNMQGIKRGLVTDAKFMEAMFRTIKENGDSLIIKPGGGADVLGNFKAVADLADAQGVARNGVVIDSNEQKAFGTGTPEAIETKPLKLNLPKDEGKDADSLLNSYPKSSRLIILVKGDDDVYAYWGDELKQGKKYSMAQMTDILKTHPKKDQIFVALRPSAGCSYKGTVNALDMMTTGGIKHYALMDIKKEEEDQLRGIYK